ncbi:hypothetical protein ACHAWF_006832 [Thalassiosira exigua]
MVMVMVRRGDAGPRRTPPTPSPSRASPHRRRRSPTAVARDGPSCVERRRRERTEREERARIEAEEWRRLREVYAGPPPRDEPSDPAGGCGAGLPCGEGREPAEEEEGKRRSGGLRRALEWIESAAREGREDGCASCFCCGEPGDRASSSSTVRCLLDYDDEDRREDLRAAAEPRMPGILEAVMGGMERTIFPFGPCGCVRSAGGDDDSFVMG